MSTSIQELREAIHNEIDRLFDRYESGAPLLATVDEPLIDGSAVVVPDGTPVDPFEHRWPDGRAEHYDRGRRYSVRVGGRALTFLLGWTKRYAFGVERRRIVVFEATGRGASAPLYPVTEFVETDWGSFAAPIPNVDRPRATLRDGQPVPEWCQPGSVARTDRLFHSVRNGPSLRLAVEESDEATMIRHALYVGHVRGRFP